MWTLNQRISNPDRCALELAVQKTAKKGDDPESDQKGPRDDFLYHKFYRGRSTIQNLFFDQLIYDGSASTLLDSNSPGVLPVIEHDQHRMRRTHADHMCGVTTSNIESVWLGLIFNCFQKRAKRAPTQNRTKKGPGMIFCIIKFYRGRSTIQNLIFDQLSYDGYASPLLDSNSPGVLPINKQR